MAKRLTLSAVLRGAAATVEPEGAWMRGNYAQDALGHTIDPTAKDARCFCMMGAVYRAAGVSFADREPPVINAARKAIRKVTGGLTTVWNDHADRTQAEVVAALREAADLAESEAR